MKKLNFDELKEKGNSIASEELLSSINGGLMDGCHVDDYYNAKPTMGPIDDSPTPWVH